MLKILQQKLLACLTPSLKDIFYSFRLLKAHKMHLVKELVYKREMMKRFFSMLMYATYSLMRPLMIKMLEDFYY